jgi:aldehyde:ferredoxin oxidoreductase
MKGFSNTYLHIDLNTKRIQIRNIEDGICKTWLGGKGLATYLLLHTLKPGIDPLSEKNPLLLTPGIGAGAIPGTSRYGVYAKSPLTNGYGESYSGGSLAPAFKGTGYDAVLIRGKSPDPVYLEITDESTTFHDASGFMGFDTHRTEIDILKEINEKKARALTIGPAGENRVRFACITNDLWRNAGRCGMGAVMGSKNLKALVFHGAKEPEFSDAPGLKEFSKRLRERGRESKGVESFRKHGTLNMAKVLDHLSGFPAKYWTEGRSEDIGKISADYLVKEMEARPKACYNCFIACGKVATVKKGRHKGLKIEGPEYETTFAFGGLCAIDSLEEIAYLNDLSDRLGMDTITAGSLIGLIMGASHRKLVDYGLEYGDAEGAAKLLRDIAYKRGFGGVLAEGINAASEKLGLQELAMHVKGLDIPGYDPRILKGMGLAYGTSARGACHLRGTYYRAELGGKSPKDPAGKAKQYIDYEDVLTIYDSLIMCKFYGVLLSREDLCELVRILTGIDYRWEGLKEIANRIVSATREFNVREGFSMKDDALPGRFHSEPLKGKILAKEEYRAMLQAYYRHRNWSLEGVPKDNIY